MIRTLFRTLILLAFLTGCSPTEEVIVPANTPTMVAIGTYTRTEGHVDGKAEGIYLARSDSSGFLTMVDTITGIVNPSYLAFSPDGKTLFAVSELSPGFDTTGYVYSYAIAEEGPALLRSRQPTYSHAPCHVRVHPSGEWILVSNYVGGVVAVYPVDEDGLIEAATQVLTHEGTGIHSRQESSHPHATTFAKNGSQVLVTDLGANVIWWYDFDKTVGRLTQTGQYRVELPPASGPRHMVVHPNGEYWYVLNELSNTLATFQRKGDEVTLVDTVATLPAGVRVANNTADIRFHTNGHLYTSNRGHNSVAHFRLDENQHPVFAGTYPSGGDAPRHIRLDPDQEHLLIANQNTDLLVRYTVDAQSGVLTLKDSLRVATPVCIAFQPQPHVSED
jgi:6-phosphogluconolactonase